MPKLPKLLTGGIWRIYFESDRTALLGPMLVFLGAQRGFMVLNFLKVRKRRVANVYR